MGQLPTRVCAARTEWTCVCTDGTISELDVVPRTGRTHQVSSLAALRTREYPSARSVPDTRPTLTVVTGVTVSEWCGGASRSWLCSALHS